MGLLPDWVFSSNRLLLRGETNSSRTFGFVYRCVCRTVRDGAAGQGYKVYYTLTPDLPTPLWTVHPVDNSQLTTVTNLLTNRTYTMKVLAFTDVGDGPLSDPLPVTTSQGGSTNPTSLITYLVTAASRVFVSNRNSKYPWNLSL